MRFWPASWVPTGWARAASSSWLGTRVDTHKQGKAPAPARGHGAPMTHGQEAREGLQALWDRRPRPHRETGIQRVGDRLLAASPDDRLHTFEDEAGQRSEVAERIVELCDGTRTVRQIADALGDEFEVEKGRCAADTLQFVRLLIERKVLELSPP